MAAWGRLDTLFNNAGIGSFSTTIDEIPVQTWLDVVSINLTGSFLCARAALPRRHAKRPAPPAMDVVATKLSRLVSPCEAGVDVSNLFRMPLFTLAAQKDQGGDQARAAIADVLKRITDADTASPRVVTTAKKQAPLDITAPGLTQPLHTHFLQSWLKHRSRCGTTTTASSSARNGNITSSNAVLITTLQNLDYSDGKQACFARQDKNTDAVSRKHDYLFSDPFSSMNLQ